MRPASSLAAAHAFGSHWNFPNQPLDSSQMRTAACHCLLALLMIFQSVNTAWAQVQLIVAPPAITQTMQPGEHCAMMAKQAANGTEFRETAAKQSKSDCPCCDHQCVPMHCASVNLQAALSAFDIRMQFSPAAFTSSRFAEAADTHYFRPPTPPPNTLQN